jgi:hypothetical protein
MKLKVEELERMEKLQDKVKELLGQVTYQSSTPIPLEKE